MKAILIVDVPSEWHCKELCIEGELRGKNEAGYWIFVNEIVEAPLKPMPEYQQYRHSAGDFTRGFTKGWNTCIKEIEKC